MSNVGIYGFDIPHAHVQPTRDMVIIQIPFPPEKIGSIITPAQTRELMSHNVAAGRIVAMGPLAFTYKDADGLQKHDVKIGDWVLIRPFAGTIMQGGQIMVNSGHRYVSSFQDIIGIVPADKMPDPDTLVWELGEAKETRAPVTDHFNFEPAVRERTVFSK